MGAEASKVDAPERSEGAHGSQTDHPVRSLKGGFAIFY